MATKKNSAKAQGNKSTEVAEVVFDGPHCVDLKTVTNGKMEVLDTRKGKLYRSGEYAYTFTENGAENKGKRPWECRVKLAEERPYARISVNSNGAFLGIYAPKENFGNTRELAELLLDQTERLCEKVTGMDVMGIIEKLDALKRQFFTRKARTIGRAVDS